MKYTTAVIVVILFSTTLLLFVNKKPSSSPSPSPTPSINAIILPEEKMEEIKELKIEDIKEGEGKEAVSGARVSVNYSGTLINGTKFDSSYDRGVPFSFNLGAGEVIKGWDMGVAGMKEGGKRRLTIPSDLAYGERGVGDIPPNSTLIFEVELIEVQ